MKRKSVFAIVLFTFVVNFTAIYAQTFGSFTDTRDGKTYKTVTLGDQVWLAENLEFKANSGCWVPDGNDENADKSGYYYSAEVAQVVAPEGWHLPTSDEFNTLLSNYKVKKRYNAFTTGGDSGFNAELNGICFVESGNIRMAGKMGAYWSTTKIADYYYALIIKTKSEENNIAVGANHTSTATCVRLVKD